MCGDRSVLLCVVSFISGVVIRRGVSVNWYCESEIVHTLVSVGWRLGAVRLE